MGSVRRVLVAVSVLLLSPLAATVASAQDDAANTTDADTPDTFIGTASDALPGYGRVGLPRPTPWLVSIAGSAGYGFTPDVLGMSDSHHRLSGRIAIGVAPLDWLQASLVFDGRYDTHSASGVSDDGLVGDPRLVLRAGGDLGGFYLGGQAKVWVPGADAPSFELSATTIDLQALAGIQASPDFTVALNAGFRIDNSAKAVENGGMNLSPSDRMALGLSDYNAVLVGLGGAYRLSSLELFADWTWDILVGGAPAGATAPSAIESPMRVGAGGRLFVGESGGIQLEARAEVLVSGYAAPATAMASLIPIEPRFSVYLGATFRLPEPARPTPTLGGGGGSDGGHGGGGAGVTDGVVTVRGRVLDAAGQPIANAEVVLTPGEGEPTEPVTTGDDGSFSFENVSRAPGATLTIRAEGYREATQEIDVTAEGATITPSVALERDLPSGQLRGVVQSFDGRTLAATIRVEPLGQEVTAGEDGSFELDVPPGDYEVVINAQGYREQRRPVSVEQQGVTILNVDMRRR